LVLGIVLVVAISQTSQVSWIICDIQLPISFKTMYFNKLIGLMGNNNDQQFDDIFSRNGIRPQNMSSERSIYQIGMSCRLLSIF
jgi:hypothetical protein